MRVKTSYVPEEVNYFTVGKEYEAVEAYPHSKYLFEIVDDFGEIATVLVTGCAHLDGQAWEIVDDAQ